MTINPVRLNHAVLFVSDLARAERFYRDVFGMLVVAREPRANAAFLRLPRSGNHHDLGLFGVGPRRPSDAAASASTTSPGRSTPSTSSSTPARRCAPRMPTPASPATVPPRASTAPTPTATNSRSCGCCPATQWGEYENAAPIDHLDLTAELRRWSGIGTAGRILPGSVDAPANTV